MARQDLKINAIQQICSKMFIRKPQSMDINFP
jgi:hypothetical protein